MRKLLLAVAAVLALSGCESLTPDEEAALRDGVAEAAISLIADANRQGINPIEMDESDLRIVYFGCSAATAFAPFVDAYIEARNVNDPEFEPIDFRGYVAAACAVAGELIQPKAPDTTPAPEPKPEV